MSGRVTKILGVSLPPRLYREVEETARKLQETKSELFREAWEAYKRSLDERDLRRLQRVARRQARSLGYEIRSEEDVDRILHER